MRKLTVPLAFFIALVAALAGAQVPFPQTLPAFTVVGRLAPTSGPSEAIPFDVLVPNLFSVGFCTTANATLVNSTANGWGCQVPLAVASGGTNCTASSGTCLDNITAFASTGFIKRTGAGAYSFVADPVPTANGGTNLTTFGAANRVLNSTSSSVLVATEQPTLGTNGGTGGQITFNGATSGSVTVTTAAAAGTTINFQLPTSNGTSGQVLTTDGSGATSWGGGSGAAPTVQRFTSSSGTYTPTGGTVRIRVRIAGGGGGGAAQATNAGANGGDTSFGSWTAIHGNGGAVAGSGGAGGTGGATGTGTLIVRFPGGQGGDGSAQSGDPLFSGAGGSNPFGGAGAAKRNGQAGGAGATNTGAGGSGGGYAFGSSGLSGGGGGASEYVEFWVTSPGATSYAIGAGGNGGAAGTNAGGNGAAGIIIIEEFYS